MNRRDCESNSHGFDGCDFAVQLGEARKGTEVRILQLTDTQIIDPSQMRTPDRLRKRTAEMWDIANIDELCFDCIRSTVAKTRPDLIIFTGDIVYGEFDDNGSVFEKICCFMDSFGIPWAPVFGNHDNETKRGVKWQCDMLEGSEYCLFKRGSVSGNGNYTVGVAAGNELLRIIYMLDSNGCGNATDPDVIKEQVICGDQTAFMRERARMLEAALGSRVKGFAAFHIATEDFIKAEQSKGYCKDLTTMYEIGVDVERRDDDFGFKKEVTEYIPESRSGGFLQTAKECGIDAVFVGHDHSINTSITYEGLKWVHGLKAGEYDYHIPGCIGGTLITLNGGDFAVKHIYYRKESEA